MMKLEKLKPLFSYLLVVVGCCFTAAAFGLIILPQGFAAGGVTGLSILLCRVVPVSVSVMVLAINALLFVAGWVFVGRDFVIKTAVTSVIFPVMMDVFQHLAWLDELKADPLVSSVLAGALLGFGASMVLLGNGSCGGFDTLGMILFKKLRWPVSAVMWVCDCVVLLGQTMSGSLLYTVYGVIVVMMCSLVINYALTYGKAEGQMMIFSEKYEEIRVALLEEEDVGMTFLEGETGYARRRLKVIITVMPHDKIDRVKRCVQRIDPMAFLLVDNVRYVGGRGYTLQR